MNRQSLTPKVSRWIANDPMGFAGAFTIALIAFAIIFAPWLTDYALQGQGEPNTIDKFLPPSAAHWFGTDHLGRDLFARVLYGGRVSLAIAILVVGLAISIGAPLGAIAGYCGGWIDEIIMRITDVFLAFPPLLLAILLSAVLGPGFVNMAIAIALSWWPWYARIARAEAASLRTRPYVEAAQIMGVGHLRIIRRHLTPSIIGPIAVQGTLDFGTAILTASSLSFLGLGVSPPTADWGQIVSNGRLYFPDRWWYVVFPGLAIFIAALAFNFLGDSLRGANKNSRED